jgi:REP element-mobilizing transposase RayT
MHSFSSCLVHCVWSTKDRAPLLDTNLRSRLWPYFGGIARENKMKALAVGGAADHVHILVSLPTTLSVAKAIQLLKGNSSKWIHETFPGLRRFEWQSGYGAFSIAISGVVATSSYIHRQDIHHKTRTFRDEFQAMLQKHNLAYANRMLD